MRSRKVTTARPKKIRRFRVRNVATAHRQKIGCVSVRNVVTADQQKIRRLSRRKGSAARGMQRASDAERQDFRDRATRRIVTARL